MAPYDTDFADHIISLCNDLLSKLNDISRNEQLHYIDADFEHEKEIKMKTIDDIVKPLFVDSLDIECNISLEFSDMIQKNFTLVNVIIHKKDL